MPFVRNAIVVSTEDIFFFFFFSDLDITLLSYHQTGCFNSRTPISEVWDNEMPVCRTSGDTPILEDLFPLLIRNILPASSLHNHLSAAQGNKPRAWGQARGLLCCEEGQGLLT